MSTVPTLYPLSTEEVAYFKSFQSWSDLIHAVNELPETGPGANFYVAFGPDPGGQLAWLERKGQDFSTPGYPTFGEYDWTVL